MKKSMLVLLLALTTAGCGQGGPRLATVTGEVTLNGQPLPKARVVFQPSGKDASPSVAETQGDGSFQLAFNRDRSGAMLGDHRVKVTTARVETTKDGKDVEIPEKLPPRYNLNSELKYTVESGSNHFKIPLEAQGNEVIPDPSTLSFGVPTSCP